MSYSNLRNKTEGFTIIEVLIVLAIAGLIMLVVFLAVPALQRNQRNTGRTNDASLVLSAVSECLANKNGQVASCDTLGELQTAGTIDTAKLRQLTTVTVTTAAPAVPTGTNAINVGFSSKCNAAGDAQQAGGTREFAALYNNESATAAAGVLRCLSS